jgi:hypothetical protein
MKILICFLFAGCATQLDPSGMSKDQRAEYYDLQLARLKAKNQRQSDFLGSLASGIGSAIGHSVQGFSK